MHNAAEDIINIKTITKKGTAMAESCVWWVPLRSETPVSNLAHQPPHILGCPKFEDNVTDLPL